jgi:two-component system sensor histidine kinase/response regulator
LENELRPSPWGVLHILVAEDNIINQKYALSVSENEGFSAVVVSNGREAMVALERERFDLVLMDVHRPDRDGFEATSNIRARERFTGKRIPIVAVTAHAMAGDRDKCLAAGMDAYVSKPIRKRELMQAIASLSKSRKLDIFPGVRESGEIPTGISQGEEFIG